MFTPSCEERFGYFGAPLYLTDSLRCLKYLALVDFRVSNIEGVECDVSLMGSLTIFSVTEENVYVAEPQVVLYASGLRYNIFAPINFKNKDSTFVVVAAKGRVTLHESRAHCWAHNIWENSGRSFL